jgi:hypothetical protein
LAAVLLAGVLMVAVSRMVSRQFAGVTGAMEAIVVDEIASLTATLDSLDSGNLTGAFASPRGLWRVFVGDCRLASRSLVVSRLRLRVPASRSAGGTRARREAHAPAARRTASAPPPSTHHKTLFESDEKYAVDNPLIDRAHKLLFAYVAGLHRAMLERRAPDVVAELLRKLVDYTSEHSRTNKTSSSTHSIRTFRITSRSIAASWSVS